MAMERTQSQNISLEAFLFISFWNIGKAFNCKALLEVGN
jgi:hypothetical protein